MPRALYAAFDLFPSNKGAATHIARFAEGMFRKFGGGILFTIGDAGMPVHLKEGDIETYRFTAPVLNFLERTEQFGAELFDLTRGRADTLEVCHFRDIWSGMPILQAVEEGTRCIFEVNALPSVELKYEFPNIHPRTMGRIRSFEAFCLQACDHIITPAHTIKRFLLELGLDISEDKITVIPNGADTKPAALKNGAMNGIKPEGRYILYFGSLKEWQGVDHIIEAFSRLRDYQDLTLVICNASKHKPIRRYARMARKLNIEDRCVWHHRLDRTRLQHLTKDAAFTLAPLLETERNVRQGCAPLKILESMAVGTPVIASDLPCITEIIDHSIDGWLIPPERVDRLERAMRLLLDSPEQCAALGQAAREKIVRSFTWDRQVERLAEVYGELNSE